MSPTIVKRIITIALVALLVIGAGSTIGHPRPAAAQLPATITILPDAGVGASASLAPGSTDERGTFTFTTTTVLSDSGPLVEVSFATPKKVIAEITPSDAPTANLVHQSWGMWVTPSAGKFTVGAVSNGNDATYTFTYLAKLQ